MKKILSFVLLLVIAMSFVACDKEVDYHEKQEVQGSYTVNDFMNKTAETLPYDISGSFVEFVFTVGEMGYSDTTYYRFFTVNARITGIDNIEIEYPIFINTTTRFYEDITKEGDALTVRGFVEVVYNHARISPAFIIT